MRRTRDTFATMAVGGFVGLAVGFAVTLGTAPADVKDNPPVVSNMAAKQDRSDGVVRRTLPKTTVVSEVQIAGAAGTVVTLLDPEGRVVYRSDPAQRETVVTRDALIPTASLRISPEAADGTPRIVNMQDAVRAAKTDPEGFLAATLGDKR
ncbi:MAG: hypothetical protein M3145_02635 [Pseudomonadota bacterium]|nr:hypothetical protein [Pseudomonadota bacterium]